MALLFGIALLPMGVITLNAGLRAALLSPAADPLQIVWALLAPLLVWFAAIAAAWFAVEVAIVRPLTTLEEMARGYARGERVEAPDDMRNAPHEISSLRRTLAAMAKTLRGRELRLAEALREERALLRELNHRVNNNLQMVASLLSIQARAATNDQQAMGLERAQERIQLLALTQKRIYSSGQVHREVQLDAMIAEIARAMTASRGARADNVELQDLAPARAPIDVAVPLAFTVGESISHALDLLQGGERAPLVVQLTRDDSWIGFAMSAPGGSGRIAAASPAKRIIDAFAGQLGAEMAYDAADPLAVRLRFALPQSEAPADETKESAASRARSAPSALASPTSGDVQTSSDR